MGYESKLIIAYSYGSTLPERVTDTYHEATGETTQERKYFQSMEAAEDHGMLGKNERIVVTWNTIATFDLSKMGYDGAFHDLRQAADVVMREERVWPAVYTDGSDTLIWRDCYDAPLTVMALDEVIAALKTDDDGYRRLAPIIAMLEAFEADKDRWPEGLRVLHWGH